MSDDTFEEFDLDDDFDPEKVDGDFEPVLAGDYHVMVDAIEPYGGSKNDSLVTDFQVIAGTNPQMKGRSHRDYTPMSYDKWAKQKRFKLACCLGLTSVEAAKAAKAEGKSLSWDWQAGVGRHMAISVERDEYEGKVKYKTPFARHFLSLEEAKSRNIPIDESSVSLAAGDDPFTKPSDNGRPGATDDSDDDPFA